ncbi:MAG TPA: hydantoinase/oxoprolinase family protein, partial [Syntrophomonadaceae bacterium]|nr:hydantoinase/oxoprolinase family protein [Syntrophomonadaceae bacterium]
MLIGIDVGGTYTDGVLFEDGSIIKDIKKPTGSDLQETLLLVLDELLQNRDQNTLERIVISTTLVTNLLATGQGDRTALMLVPGRGLPASSYCICPDTYFLQGGVDFRGHIVENLDQEQLETALEDIKDKGINKIAVACKFSNRNDSIEKTIRKFIKNKCPQMEVAIGCETAGKLNFIRRAVTTYYTAMTMSRWSQFVNDFEQALTRRNINVQVEVLKADGGTMPLHNSIGTPCETVFSGPAASTMGGVALTMDRKNSVVIDIGGTTSDISLIIEGEPLYASKGANIDNKFTHINSFAVRSLALGGDSEVDIKNGCVFVEPNRKGDAACFGGPVPTVTDVFNFKYDLNIGDCSRSRSMLQETAQNAGIELESLCQQVVDTVIAKLQSLITTMFKEWENEPAYRVWEVVNRKKFQLDRIIGIGAAAQAIVPQLAKSMNLEYLIHRYSPVANALGACIARPTIAFNLHVDTQYQKYFIDYNGISGSIANARNFQLQDARNLALENLNRLAEEKGMKNYASEARFDREEQFNVIRGWDRAGKVYEISVQIAPGFINGFKGVKR